MEMRFLELTQMKKSAPSKQAAKKPAAKASAKPAAKKSAKKGK
jgi:hypothetical protein